MNLNSANSRNGHSFEYVVEELYKDRLCVPKGRNVVVKKRKFWFFGKEEIREFDIVMSNVARTKTYYVECKYKKDLDSRVGLSEVKEFNEKIKSHSSKGIIHTEYHMITNRSFTKEAMDYASLHRIKTIDGESIKTMRKDPAAMAFGTVRNLFEYNEFGIVGVVKKLIARNKPVEWQVEKNWFPYSSG